MANDDRAQAQSVHDAVQQLLQEVRGEISAARDQRPVGSGANPQDVTVPALDYYATKTELARLSEKVTVAVMELQGLVNALSGNINQLKWGVLALVAIVTLVFVALAFFGFGSSPRG